MTKATNFKVGNISNMVIEWCYLSGWGWNDTKLV